MSGEAALWEWLRGGKLPRGHYCRIESETAVGFPDVNYCLSGVEGNIELKVSKSPNAYRPFKTWGLRPTQKKWIRSRVREKGRVWILAQIGDMLLLIHGKHVDEFNTMTYDDLIGCASHYWIKGLHNFETKDRIHVFLVRDMYHGRW